MIWRPADNQRWFANVSACQEPATFHEIINSSDGRLTKLDPQKGVTFEIGGDGDITEQLKWNVALYRSFIKDEYITTYDSEEISPASLIMPPKPVIRGWKQELTA